MIARRRDMHSAKTMPVPDTERIVLAVASDRQSSVARERSTVRTSVRVPAVVVVRAIDLCGPTGGGCSQSRGEG
jgi:hypothetical protein